MVQAAHQQEEDALGKAYDARLMRRLLEYLRPYRPRVVVAVLMLLGAAAVEMAGPLLTRLVIDRAIPERDGQLLLLLTTAYLGTLLFAFAFEYLQLLLTTWLGQHVMYDLRRQVFAQLQRLPLPYYDRNPVGRLMTRVTSDVEVLNELFSSGVVAVFGDLFALLFIVIALFVLDWQLALVTLLVMPLVFTSALVFRRRIRDAYRDIRVRLARINAYLQERISGVSVVQLFGREQATIEQFRTINDDHLQAHLRSIRYYALFFPVIELLTAISFALIISYGGWEVLHGSMTVGSVFAFLLYARRFFRPIQDLSEKYNMLQGAMASSERIFKLLDTPVAHEAGGRPLSGLARGHIEFRDVWFAYRTRPDLTAAAEGEAWDWVLRGVSFSAAPGERVAVVGHTGAGKTTIISLLMRFYEPQQGDILLDGISIREYDVLSLRRRIALVLQDVFIFSRDISYNIRLGDEDISDERVRAAAEQVGANAFIERLPQGYHEPLGERGVSLSVGERQLLSFARALAFDPLVLVLDEATSSVDSALEERIERALDTLMRGRTSIVIAHRLSTIQHADRILVLHNGELREQGTHAELLQRGGLYARLYELQFAPLPPRRGTAEGAARDSVGVPQVAQKLPPQPDGTAGALPPAGTERRVPGGTIEGTMADTAILVVDDDPNAIDIVRTYLEARGYQVSTARDGKEALSKLESVRPALVLLDVMMPGMDGWEVARVIKNHPQFGHTTRVVMLTARSDYQDKHEGLRAGADDYLVKPIQLAELGARVERNLKARETAR